MRPFKVNKHIANRRVSRLRLEGLEERTNPVAGIGFLNPDTATWALRSTASPGTADIGTFKFGAGAEPVVGDWNGDGVDDIGSFDRNTATWSLRYGTSAGPANAGVFKFGKPGSLPVVGDWNGDGRDDIGVFEKTTATWSLRIGASAGPANAGTFSFGGKNLIPVVGDWDGDGTDGIGVFNKSNFTWSIRQTATAGAASATFQFGRKNADPVVGDWNGDGKDGIGIFVRESASWSLRQTASAGAADIGNFILGTAQTIPIVGNFTVPVASEDALLTLNLPPLDVDLLGLKVQSSPITVTVTAEAGDGKLLGNLLTTVSNVVNVDQINGALNAVLGTTVELLNSADLDVSNVGDGPFSTAPASTTQVLELFIAPVHLDLMGARIDTSPIRLAISAQAGDGLILGNVLTKLSDLFNPPLPDQLDLAYLNERLGQLLADIRAQIPGIPAAESPPPVLGEGQFLALTVPAIDLDLLGLVLKTTPITVNATAQEGNGHLLGNLFTVVFNQIDATPAELSELNGNINNVLAQVVGVLNASHLTLPTGALDSLSDVMERLSLPNLITATPGATAPILDLLIASPDGTPPVKVDLLGVNVTTSNIDAELSARTGEGLVLGNLLYNVANLVNPGGPASLISLMTSLATGSVTPTNLFGVVTGLSPVAPASTEVLKLTLPALDLDLLGLEINSDAPITVTVSAREGNGLLLGNVLTSVSALLNTTGVSKALNNVLSTTVGLLNSSDLAVTGLAGGLFDSAAPSTTQVLDLFVAPVQLDLLGVSVDTSPIHLTVTARSGEGLILGNILTELTHLFDPPLPEQIVLADINTQLENLLARVNSAIPNIPAAESPAPVLGEGQFLALTVPAIDLNLLGLLLKTTPITVNATAQEGDGELLGNLLKVVFNTIEATPAELTRLNTTVNAILAKVVGALNAADLTLPPNAVSTLSTAMQTLALPNLISAPPGSVVNILNLVVASQDETPPVNVDLLGLLVTTSDINVDLSAQTGEGLILGNLLFNLANLLNPSATNLLPLLLQLGL